MILGVKCEGCRMWTRITSITMEIGKIEHYYCDECLDNVTYHKTMATIKYE